MTDGSYLQALIAPLSEDDYRAAITQGCSLYLPPEVSRLERLGELCDWRIADLLAGRADPVVMWFNARDGRHLTADVSPAVARGLYDAGLTMYLTDIAALEPVSRDIATGLRAPRPNVRNAVFCNQPGAITPMHFDPVDTLTVQVKGSKRWWIAPNPAAAHPTVSWAQGDEGTQPELWQYAHEQFPTEMPSDTEEHLRRPGAVLNAPRGWWHHTRSDEESISLHIHHSPVPWVDAVLITLRARLVRDAAWRAPASGIWDPRCRPDVESTTTALLHDLREIVATLEPADVLPVVDSPPPAPTVTRRAGAGIRIHADEHGNYEAIVNVNEYGIERHTTLRVNHRHAAACGLLTAGEPTKLLELVDQVPPLDEADADALVRELAAAGFVRPA
jgi:50S ribosomal protein L16 3-hydroxylase